MGNDFFRFKQFVVRQGGAAMKVGVDSVLLGTWVDVENATRVLDIGAGTGLLSLMIAQRNVIATIDAIEIDSETCRQAQENAAESPWAERVRIVCGDFRDYVADCPLRYDLIVSNPPYFTASLKPGNEKRSAARHNDSLPHHDLVAGAAQLLAPGGVMAVVLPPAEAHKLIDEAANCGLSVKRLLHVQTLPSKPAYRMLVELSKTETTSDSRILCIEKDDRSDFTEEYKQLTRDFYLKF